MVKTLLLVDDDPFVRGALTRALNRAGAFTVVPAEHGRHALELLDTEHVDVMLTDLQMTVMDGLTLLSHLVQRGLRLPVAIMTGHAIAPALRQRLQAYGIAATFTKPVDVAVLADELQRALDPETVGRIRGITLFGLLQLLEVEQKTGLDIFYKRRAREHTVEERLQGVLMEAARLLDERGCPGAPSEPVAPPAPAAAAPARAAPVVDRIPEQALLEEALTIDGALGVALVHATSGMAVGHAGGGRALDMDAAAAGAAEVARAAIGTLQKDDTIQDIMITLGKQYHVIRFLRPGSDMFLCLVFDRERTSLGMARHRLAQLARRMRA